jgi:hypothetical protein
MASHVQHHVVYSLANTPVRAHPFPHVYVRDVFPEDFYREVRAHLPPPAAFTSLKTLGRVSAGYPDTRWVLPITPEAVGALDEPYRTFWTWFGEQFLAGEFLERMLAHFAPWLEQRWGGAFRGLRFRDEAMLVLDRSTYALRPHTDITEKVLSFLFYFPADDAMAHLGTSIYASKEPGFTCDGAVHHPFERFHLVKTMPYVPNALFAFVRTRDSFHGVEAIKETDVRRDLLLYDVKVLNPPELQEADMQRALREGTSQTRFTF